VVNRGENKWYASFNEWWYNKWINRGYNNNDFVDSWYSNDYSAYKESGYLYQKIEEVVYKRLTKREIESLWKKTDLWIYSGK
jgi:hypothetical protein